MIAQPKHKAARLLNCQSLHEHFFLICLTIFRCIFKERIHYKFPYLENGVLKEHVMQRVDMM